MSIVKSTVYESHPVSGVEIHFWKLTEALDDLCGMLTDKTVLSEAPYVTFKSDKRKREWVAVRVLLGQVCRQPVSICYKSNGKPFLEPRISEFSISHTKSVVAIALSECSVGIDVEQIGARPLSLRAQYLSNDDFDPASVEFAELMATFMWSAKESVYKLVGVPGVELKADIRMQVQHIGADFTIFYAEISRLHLKAMVNCYAYETFVLTVATFC